MPKFDETNAEVLVFTFKEGVLAAMGHDLKLRVTKFQMEVDEAKTTLTAKIDARSLRVVAAMRDGRERLEDSAALSASDRDKIDRAIIDDVLLQKGRFAEITFVSTKIDLLPAGGHRIDGRLTIRGVERSVQLTTRIDGGKETCDVRLHQPDFGIKPFRAALGGLRVKPEALVRVTI